MDVRARTRERFRENVHDPVWWTEILQLVKTVVASVVAWVVAAQVFGLPQAFLAPWAALLVVHATVYRTFSRGLRQVTGAVLGVLLAWLAGNFLGLTTFAVSRAARRRACWSAACAGSATRAPRSRRPG